MSTAMYIEIRGKYGVGRYAFCRPIIVEKFWLAQHFLEEHFLNSNVSKNEE
jgi:hypothetical protein